MVDFRRHFAVIGGDVFGPVVGGRDAERDYGRQGGKSLWASLADREQSRAAAFDAGSDGNEVVLVERLDGHLWFSLTVEVLGERARERLHGAVEPGSRVRRNADDARFEQLDVVDDVALGLLVPRCALLGDAGTDAHAQLGAVGDRRGGLHRSRVGIVDHDGVEMQQHDIAVVRRGCLLDGAEHILGDVVVVVEEDRHAVAGGPQHVLDGGLGHPIAVQIDHCRRRDAREPLLAVIGLRHRLQDGHEHLELHAAVTLDRHWNVHAASFRIALPVDRCGFRVPEDGDPSARRPCPMKTC